MNRDGKPIYVIRLPKYKKGEHSVQAKMVAPSFSKFKKNKFKNNYMLKSM